MKMAYLLNSSAEGYLPLSVEPKLDLEGVQKRNRLELALWKVNVLHQPLAGKPGVISVTVAAAEAPALTPMTPVTWNGLRVDFWQSGESSGLFFVADGVSQVLNRRAE
jgi:hypothetical protein